MKRKKKKNFFTLLEMIVVIAIIALLAAVVTPMYMHFLEKAKVSTAKDQVSLLVQAVQDYQIDTGNLPSSLQCLVTNVDNTPSWDGPYLNHDKLPNDPWGSPYVYEKPGYNGATFSIFSYGSAGPAGGQDGKTVIGSWMED